MKLYAEVLLDDPIGTSADGQMFVLAGGLEWQPVEWLDPWNCDHLESMCATCVDTWQIDYTVRLPAGIEA